VKIVAGLACLVGLAVAGAALVGSGVGGRLHDAGQVTPAPRPDPLQTQAASRQRDAAAAHGVSNVKPVLFGDLHVHTTFSSDAFLFSLPIIQGEGVHPPADACDFARFCSQLDFFALTDHAELLSPRQWRESRESVRACNAAAGDPDSPDLNAYLGFEWTDMAVDGSRTHYGHKNVIFRETADDAVPARPISAASNMMDGALRSMGVVGGVVLTALDWPRLRPSLDFNRYRREVAALPFCPAGVPSRELGLDCVEVAPTPRDLFSKLDEWDTDSLVIPHGTSWGIHAPPGASLAAQLDQHDPARERLFEVYSGHGSSEVFRPWRHVETGPGGERVCPAPSPGFEPCCHRAGELMRRACDDPASVACEQQVAQARSLFLEAGSDPRRFHIVPGVADADWLTCGTLTDGFLGAYLYRPRMSAQYGLALTRATRDGEARRFRFGLIASSDNHKARAGAGYKEFARKAMGDAWGPRLDLIEAVTPSEPRTAEGPIPFEEVAPGALVAPERGASFYSTGGLVAVHAESRERDDLFAALRRREVYGTSGDRILLWFDLLTEQGERLPMGSEVPFSDTPRFEVRAVGAWEQRPGCDPGVVERLGVERLEQLCLGECYRPASRRRLIERIEVVRILAQTRPDEPVVSLVADPWRSFSCPPDPEGCRVSFEDPDYASAGREVVYYVRALQAPSLAVGGDPLRCERDELGDCVAARPCYASGPDFDPQDDCLAPVQERAWSSPIFLKPERAGETVGIGGRSTPRS